MTNDNYEGLGDFKVKTLEGVPFIEGVKKLHERKYRLPSAKELAFLNFRHGWDSDIALLNHPLSQDIVYTPQGNTFLIKNSLIINQITDPRVKNVPKGQFYEINPQELERILQGAIPLTVGRHLTKQPKVDLVLYSLFENYAESYLRGVHRKGYDTFEVELMSKEEVAKIGRPFAVNALLYGINSGPKLCGNVNLHERTRLVGIR